MIDFKKFNSVISLTSYFNSNEKCKQVIIQSRWSDGDVVCPYCGGHHCVTRKDGKFRCKHCRKNFSCLVGTTSRILNCHSSSGSWLCTLFLPTRRVSVPTSLQGTLR